MANTIFTPGKLPLPLYKGATFGPILLYARQADQVTVIPLTGWGAHAKVRKTDGGPVIIDLLPVISNGPTGEITIPAISDEATAGDAFPLGCFVWDLLLERPSGEIVGPFIADSFTIQWARARA